jgi:hypothetical protein
MNQRERLLAAYNAWQIERTNLSARESSVTDPVAPGDWEASDDAGIELLHSFAAFDWNVLPAERPDHWAEDREFPVADWRAEVADDNTRQSYVDWVASQRGELADNVLAEPAPLPPNWQVADLHDPDSPDLADNILAVSDDVDPFAYAEHTEDANAGSDDDQAEPYASDEPIEGGYR